MKTVEKQVMYCESTGGYISKYDIFKKFPQLEMSVSWEKAVDFSKMYIVKHFIRLYLQWFWKEKIRFKKFINVSGTIENIF